MSLFNLFWYSLRYVLEMLTINFSQDVLKTNKSIKFCRALAQAVFITIISFTHPSIRSPIQQLGNGQSRQVKDKAKVKAKVMVKFNHMVKDIVLMKGIVKNKNMFKHQKKTIVKDMIKFKDKAKLKERDKV